MSARNVKVRIGINPEKNLINDCTTVTKKVISICWNYESNLRL